MKARAFLELAKFLGEEKTPGSVVICQKFSQNDLAAMALKRSVDS